MRIFKTYLSCKSFLVKSAAEFRISPNVVSVFRIYFYLPLRKKYFM